MNALKRNPCFQVEVEGGAMIGYNRAMLLSEIRRLGSVDEAARAVPIPCEHARELVKTMNRYSRRPLVEELREGKGRVQLTEEGERAVHEFWRFYEELKIARCELIRGLGIASSSPVCQGKE
ncbi:MAG: LysR family transcriptional regulator [Nitrospirales bacterium]|nr:LysR family transcriptional regulator [Nitrospirales bacterium]